MLEDPLNLACVMRELRRRERVGTIKILPPPLGLREGRWIYPTFREYLRMKIADQIKNPEQVDYEAEVFPAESDNYYILFRDGNEVGPFDSLRSAEKELHNLFKSFGNVVLLEPPWDSEDTSTYLL